VGTSDAAAPSNRCGPPARYPVGPMWPPATVLVVGVASAVVFVVAPFAGQPAVLLLAGVAMALSSGVGAFVVVLRDARRNGTGWWRAAGRAFREAFSWFWDLLW